MVFLFGDFELDELTCELSRAGRPVDLEPRVFHMLNYLLRHRERVVSGTELMDELWPGVAVGPDSVGNCIWAARKATGDSGKEQKVIKTLPRRGYRFVAPIRERVPSALPDLSAVGGRRSVATGTTLLAVGFDAAVDVDDRHFQAARRRAIRIVRAGFQTYGGEEGSVPDGVYAAAFGSAVRALRCARSIRIRAEQFGILHPDGRAGFGIGICGAGGSDRPVPGDSLDLACRLAAVAKDGEILAAAPLGELAAGLQDLTATPAGSVRLSGDPTPVPVCRVGRSTGATAAARLEESLSIEAPLAGRDDELNELIRCAGAVVEEGRGAVVFVSGETGVGKTRLLSEFALASAAMGFRVFSGACYEASGAPAYEPFAEILPALFTCFAGSDLQEDLGAEVAWVARAFPGLAGVRASPPMLPSLPAEQERHLLLGSTTSLILATARRAPLLLILEDLHWADTSTVFLLSHLVRRFTEVPLLIAGTYRNTEVDEAHILETLLPELRRRRDCDFFALSGLDRRKVFSLLTALARDVPPERIAGTVHEVTEGNPLFIEELLKSLCVDRRLFDGVGHWRRSLEFQPADLPEGVRPIIKRRLGGLDVQTRRVLAIAAVVGRRFPYDVLEAAADVPPAVLLAAVEKAEQAGLIHGDNKSGRIIYRFHHELVRQSLYGDLAGPRRQRLHRAAADALEGSYGGECEEHATELAYHYRLAGSEADPVLARRYLILSGDAALGAGAFDNAARDYAAALDLAEEGTTEHAKLLFRLGDARSRTGDPSAAGDLLDRAASEHKALGETERAEHAYLTLTMHLGLSGDLPGMSGALHNGLDVAPDSDSKARSLLLATAGRWFVLLDQPTAAEQALGRALEIARQRDDNLLLGAALAARGGVEWAYTNFSTALTTLTEARDRLRVAGDLITLSICKSDIASVMGYLGRLDEIAGPVSALRELAGRLGYPSGEAVVALFEGLLALVRGDLSVAKSDSERALDTARSGAFLIVPAALQLLAEVEFARGNCSSATDLFAEATQMNMAVGNPPVRYVGPLSVMRLSPFLGDGAGISGFDLPEPPAPGSPVSCALYDGMAIAAEGLVVVGRDGEAGRYYDPLAAMAEHGVQFTSGSYSMLQRILGMIAAAHGWRDRALEHHQAALAQAESLGARKEVAETMYWQAKAILAGKGARVRRQGRGLAGQAAGLYGEIGMPRHGERADALGSSG